MRTKTPSKEAQDLADEFLAAMEAEKLIDPSCTLACLIQGVKDGAESKADDLRTVLRSLISCGGTSATIKAMAMNTLEAGSGDAWLSKRANTENGRSSS